MERFPNPFAAGTQFSAADVFDRAGGVLNHVKLVKHRLGIAAVLGDPALIGRAHVHADLRDRMPMAIMLFQSFYEFGPGLLVLAFGRKEDPFADQIGEDGEILVAFAHAQYLRMIVAESTSAILRTPDGFPEFCRLTDLQKHRPALSLKAAFGNLPV